MNDSRRPPSPSPCANTAAGAASAPAADPTPAPTPVAAKHTPPAPWSEQQALQTLAEKGFIHDAAHQLRTPLAGIISQAELALQESDPQQLHQRIRKIHAAASRGAQLVKQMLALARSEASAPDCSASATYDLAQLAREVTREWIPKSLSLNKDLGYEGAHSAWVRGNRFMMREAISNLIDNALNYTAADGHITVRVQISATPPGATPHPATETALASHTAPATSTHQAHAADRLDGSNNNKGGDERPCSPKQHTADPAVPSASSALSAAPVPHPASGPHPAQPSGDAGNSAHHGGPCRHGAALASVILEVIDNGPGVAPEQLPHVFERFWRADDAHSSGSGLGLPLVQRIAAQHGGHASAHNTQPRGFIVRLCLPAAAADENEGGQGESTNKREA